MLLDEEAKIDKGEPWGHPIGESRTRRFVSYWSGPFSGIKQEFKYFQPVNDVMNNMEASHLSPGMVFDAFFGVMVFELALSEPENGDVAQTTAWKTSAIAFAFITPFALLLPPVTVMHVRVLSCVSRPRLRKFIGKWSDEFSLPHAMRTMVSPYRFHLLSSPRPPTASSSCSLLSPLAGLVDGDGGRRPTRLRHASDLRRIGTRLLEFNPLCTSNPPPPPSTLYPLPSNPWQEHKLWGWGVAAAWALGVLICFALSWRTIQMYFDAWLPWEDARQVCFSSPDLVTSKFHHLLCEHPLI